jgi:NAD(P)-dependent dehydrogenase (short-subunit alcohol dehydrogenase family)
MTLRHLASYADLTNRGVFISGGATGIGLDLVTAFHQQGAKVSFVDIDQGAGEALADALPGVVFTYCDVTDTKALCAALDAAEARIPTDVLINNAANDTRIPISETDEAAWERSINVNLRHQFFAARHAAIAMKKRRRGAIVNFASVAPEMMIKNLSAYSICKSAIRGLTRSLARELGSYGIRANSVLPGAILTERQRQLWYKDQSAIDAVVAKQCLARELSGRDVAEMALFLASDASAACTAQDFIVDGGMI